MKPVVTSGGSWAVTMAAAMPRAAFLLQASPTVGFGHAARCLALAQAMAQSWDIAFAVNRSAAPSVARRDVDVVAIFDDGRPGDVLSVLLEGQSIHPSLIVIDDYSVDRRLETKLKACGAKIVVIDDLADRPHAAEVLIDSNPSRIEKDYSGLVPPGTQLLVGADYALLRPEFQCARLRRNKADEGAGDRLRVLVSLGATDPGNVTAFVLSALSQCGVPISATVVLGASAPHLDHVRRMLPSLGFPVGLVVDAPDMCAQYASHDLAIGAPATSALERACVGLPSLLLMTADNQVQLGKALHEAGAAEFLGDAVGLEPAQVSAALIQLSQDVARRERLRAAGMRLVDGHGAPRTAANLLPSFKTIHGRPLVGRRLRRGDADAILAWQSHPESRRFSRNAAAPSAQEHAEWIDRRLHPSPAVTEIIMLDTDPVAMVRLDPIGDEFEVSILVAPQAQGQGIGEAAIRYIDALRGSRPVTAHVHPGNAASLRLFAKCGYGAGAQRKLIIMDDSQRTGASR